MFSTVFIQITTFMAPVLIETLTLFGIVALFQFRRKTKPLKIWLPITYLTIYFVTWISLTVGQVVSAAGGDTALAAFMVNTNVDAALFAGPVLITYAALIYLRRFRPAAMFFGLFAILPTLLWAIFSKEPVGLTVIQGITVPTNGAIGLMIGLVPFAVSHILLGVLALLSWRRTRSGSDLYLTIGGFVGVGPLILGGLALFLKSGPFVMLDVLYIALYFLPVILGFVGKAHPEKAIERDPVLYLRRKLWLKSFCFSFVIASLAIYLITLTSTTAITGTMEANDVEALEQVLTGKASEYERLTSEAGRSADALANLLDDAPEDGLPGVIEDWSAHHDAFVLVSRPDGSVIGASYPWIDSMAHGLLPRGDGSRAVRLVYAGNMGWSLAADAVMPKKGSLLTVLYPFGLYGDFLASNPFRGYSSGVLSPAGEVIISRGSVPGPEDIGRMLSGPRQSGQPATGGTDSIASYRVQPLRSSDGDIGGYVYSHMTFLERDARTVSIGIMLSQVGLLIGAIVFLLLIFGLRKLTKPVARLGQAAEMLKLENYDVDLKYDSPDEIGAAMWSFSEMARTIRRRTFLLKEKIREQRDFLNYVAHEIKTPVGATRWTLDLLEEEEKSRKKKDPERAELIRNAVEANNRLGALVDDLLEFARLERGALTVKPESIDLISAVDSAVEELAPACVANGVRISWLRPHSLSMIRADRRRLAQILANVIGNAIKYSDKGGIVSVSAVETGGTPDSSKRFVRVAVQDSGIGIPESQQGGIFSRFYRAKNAVESGRDGTGLGLYVTRSLLEMQGGDIWFFSREGMGTTFEFTLPVAEG